MIIIIQDDLDMLHENGLLDRLLEDKTTKVNIIWATDAYSDRGEQYQRDAKITSDMITGDHRGIIKTRARKEFEQRSERTRQHAEVFTPLWVCNRMNNDSDEVWFGAKDVFNVDGEPTERIVFPEEKDWKQYVDSRRLEITCGEAPYLVSRYDVESGEMLPIPQRIGILDRKLRVVNENVANEADWIKWAIRSVQATYGYEFQGDNLLIARTNLVMTFMEYYRARFGKEPGKPLLRKIVNIVSWNIWQMNGLTDKVPFNDQMKESISLFDQNLSEKDIQHCKIYDWRRDNAIKFFKLKNTKERSTKDRKEVRNMKFDFIIGNPPYQEEQDGDNKTFAPPIYHSFLEDSYQISNKVELIHPARFLFNAGSTPKDFNRRMLNDPHLKVLFYEEDASKVFPGTEIKAGIAITYRDATQNFGAINIFTKYAELNSIKDKAAPLDESGSISSIVFTQNRFNLDTLYKHHPELKKVIGSEGKDKRFRNNIFDKIPLFEETKKKKDDVEVIGVVNNKRCWRYISNDYIDHDHENLEYWKVIVPRANGKGVLSDILSTPVVIAPHQAYTQTFVGIGAFDSKQKAENALKYIKTKFARALLCVLKVDQHNEKDTWQMIPLQDFSDQSDINWKESVRDIDRQLYKKYGLTDSEISFLENNVKEMA